MGMDKEIQVMVEELRAWVAQHAGALGDEADILRELFDTLCGALCTQADMPARIAAPNVVVEVKDQQTGHIYRRYLELGYEENDNGIRLSGEDISGKPVQVVFLSNTALEKLHDLRGQGPDAPHCDHEH